MQLPSREVRSILIIDDDRDDFELVLEAIQQINPAIAVYYVGTCEEAIQYKELKIDLVFLDINMPQSDGFHWLRAIRAHGYKDLPIIMYTNSMSPVHIVRAYEEGATLYFSKPDSFTNLLKGLKELIRMDWSSPITVTQQYLQKGRYSTFQFD